MKDGGLLQKLFLIQTELKAPKNQFNSYGNYKYRSCEDILEAVKPLLAKNNVALRITDDIVQIGERIYVKATVILTDGAETIENVAFAREEETKKGMDGSQITGASSSYARKYALNGLFLIDDTKDSDATNTFGKDEKTEEKGKKENTKEAKKESEKPILKASPKQIELLHTLVAEGDPWAKMLKWAGVDKVEDMTAEKASEIITKKTAKKKENANG